MLSSNEHVTLRLTAFEIFAVKWPKFISKFRIHGIPGGTAPKRGEDLSETDMYHHAKFHADRCHRVAEISVTGQRKYSNRNSFILTYGR